MRVKKSASEVRRTRNYSASDVEEGMVVEGAGRRGMTKSGYLRWLVANDAAGVDVPVASPRGVDEVVARPSVFSSGSSEAIAERRRRVTKAGGGTEGEDGGE